jgi:hypothetical protein
VTARVDSTGIEKMLRGVRRVTSGLQKQLVRELQSDAPGLAGRMKGAAHTGIQRKAAAGISVSRDSQGVTFTGSGVLWAGGEYGGGKNQKVTYSTRSRAGRAYAVRRRTTKQFLPHLGTEGYFFWPTYRDALPDLIRKQEQTIDKAMGGR